MREWHCGRPRRRLQLARIRRFRDRFHGKDRRGMGQCVADRGTAGNECVGEMQIGLQGHLAQRRQLDQARVMAAAIMSPGSAAVGPGQSVASAMAAAVRRPNAPTPPCDGDHGRVPAPHASQARLPGLGGDLVERGRASRSLILPHAGVEPRPGKPGESFLCRRRQSRRAGRPAAAWPGWAAGRSGFRRARRRRQVESPRPSQLRGLAPRVPQSARICMKAGIAAATSYSRA